MMNEIPDVPVVPSTELQGGAAGGAVQAIHTAEYTQALATGNGGPKFHSEIVINGQTDWFAALSQTKLTIDPVAGIANLVWAGLTALIVAGNRDTCLPSWALSMSAPSSWSKRRHSSCPLLAATWAGVHPRAGRRPRQGHP